MAFDPDNTLSIKDEPELRHALAHMYYAIEALAKGQKNEAIYELKSIEALIFWEDDEHMSAQLEKPMKNCKGKKKKKSCKGKRK